MYKEFITAHYVFHYQADSLAEIEIKEIAAEQENWFADMALKNIWNFIDVMMLIFTECRKIFYHTLEEVEDMFWLYVEGESLDAELEKKNGFVIKARDWRRRGELAWQKI